MRLYILIKGSIIKWCYTSYNRVIIQEVAVFPKALTAEARMKGKVKLLECEKQVLKEKKIDKISCSEEVPSSMNKEQPPKVTKLTKVIITACSCLIAFSAKYANSNFCFLYHIHIISSISYCKGNSLHVLFDECDYFCLLVRS